MVDKKKEKDLEEFESIKTEIENKNNENALNSEYQTVLQALTSQNTDSSSDMNKIVDTLLGSKFNLETKTEIRFPVKFASLSEYANFLESMNLKRSAKRIRSYMNFIQIYSISKDRKSRNEIVKVFEKSMQTNNDFLPNSQLFNSNAYKNTSGRKIGRAM